LNVTTKISFRDYGIYKQKAAGSVKKAYQLSDRMSAARTSMHFHCEAMKIEATGIRRQHDG